MDKIINDGHRSDVKKVMAEKTITQKNKKESELVAVIQFC